MAGPLNSWPQWTVHGICVNAVGNPRLCRAELGSGVQGEECCWIHDGYIYVMQQHNNKIYLMRKILEQDLTQGWEDIPFGTEPQIKQGPDGLFNAQRIDTPGTIRHPLTGKWLCYCSGHNGQQFWPPGATSGDVMSIFVSTRDDPPALASPWNQINVPIIWPTERWEQAFLINGTTAARGGCTECTPVFVPKPHPTQPWPNGFIRVFYRGQTSQFINPTTHEGTGYWYWSHSYADSENGIDGWVKNTTPFWDPEDSSNIAYRWTQPPPVGYSYRGAWQGNFHGDVRADGVHGFMMVSNLNSTGTPAGAPFTRGVNAQIWSPDWGDTWEESPLRIEPVHQRQSVILWPGMDGVGVSSLGFTRPITMVIDETHPSVPGQPGGRYIGFVNSGEDRTGPSYISPPRATLAISAPRPQSAPMWFAKP